MSTGTDTATKKSTSKKSTATGGASIERSADTIALARSICASLMVGKQAIHMTPDYIQNIIKTSVDIADAFETYIQ